MRRKEKQITEKVVIDEIFKSNTICRVALAVENQPYIVPISYGYKNNALYFHSASEGRKIEMLKKNNQVCFEISDSVSLVTGDTACGYGSRFRSLIGFGKITFVENEPEKIEGLKVIMNQHTGKKEWEFRPEVLSKTLVLKLEIESLSGKISGF